MLRLSRAERLLLMTLRRFVMGLGLCRGVMQEFEALCGSQALQVLLRLQGFLTTLDRTARRKLTVAPPGWFDPTMDEQRMLAMISAAQGCQEARLTALVCWFAPWEQQRILVESTYALAGVLAAHRLRVGAGGQARSSADLA